MGDRERSGELTSWCCRAERRPHTEGPRQEGEVPPLLEIKTVSGWGEYWDHTVWSKGPHGQRSPNGAPPTRRGRLLLVGARSKFEEHCFP